MHRIIISITIRHTDKSAKVLSDLTQYCLERGRAQGEIRQRLYRSDWLSSFLPFTVQHMI